MHPLVKSVEYAVRGALPIRAEALSAVSQDTHTNKRGTVVDNHSFFLAIEKGSLQIEL